MPTDPGYPPQPNLSDLDDHRLAATLAAEAGRALVTLRNRGRLVDWAPWELGENGDLEAHRLLMDRLAEARPDDAVLSEEGKDSDHRLGADRTWIVDPLDGSYDYASGHSPDYAVHVALVRDGSPVAGAVALPASDEVFATDDRPSPDPGRAAPVVVASRAQARWGMAIAEALGGSAVIAGSAGVKAMAVVRGDADVYVHPSGLYEWDACGPEAVAVAAGLEVLDLETGPIRYNKPYPVVRGFLVARPRFVQPVLDLLA